MTRPSSPALLFRCPVCNAAIGQLCTRGVEQDGPINLRIAHRARRLLVDPMDRDAVNAMKVGARLLRDEWG